MYKGAKIGIDLGATFIKMALVDHSGRMYFRREIKTPANSEKAHLINSIVTNVESIIRESGLKKSKFLGVGIGVPGLVDSKKGIVHTLTNIKGWRGVPLRRILEKRLGLKIGVDNDVNAMTLAEYKFGAGKGADNIICLTLGTGVGGGIIIEGRLYRGNSMSAGEIGHMPINENGPRCNCGGRGCLESYIGNRYILQRAKKAFGDYIKLEYITFLAKRGDRKALDIWEEVAEKLSVALTGVINLLNPDRIIIGGGVSNAGSFILKPLKEEIKKRAMQVPASHVKIVIAKLGADAGIIGASLLVDKED